MYRYHSAYPRWVEILLTGLLFILVAACALALLIVAFAPRGEDGASEIFEHELRIVTTNSMDECEFTDVSGYEIKSIPKNSMIVVERLPDDEAAAAAWYADLEVGDVLTVRYTYIHQVTITHRITSITEKDDGGYIIELAGDNTASDESMLYQVIDTSDETSTNYVIGRVAGQSRFWGAIVGSLQRVFYYASR